jgi:hypothetical protein
MTPHMPATEAHQDRRPYEICCASVEHVGAEGHRTKNRVLVEIDMKHGKNTCTFLISLFCFASYPRRLS